MEQLRAALRGGLRVKIIRHVGQASASTLVAAQTANDAATRNARGERIAMGVAISGAIVAGFSHTTGFGPFAAVAMGRTDNLSLRFAAAMALAFNVLMVAIAIVAMVLTVPKRGQPSE
jgi:hypothetical protein